MIFYLVESVIAYYLRGFKQHFRLFLEHVFQCSKTHRQSGV